MYNKLISALSKIAPEFPDQILVKILLFWKIQYDYI